MQQTAKKKKKPHEMHTQSVNFMVLAKFRDTCYLQAPKTCCLDQIKDVKHLRKLAVVLLLPLQY